MLDRFARLLGISPTVAAILVALLVVQVATQIYALVDLARRDRVRGGKKWVWALLVALGNLPGAIVYLAAGRVTSIESSTNGGTGATAAGADAARRALDVLYEPRDRR